MSPPGYQAPVNWFRNKRQEGLAGRKWVVKEEGKLRDDFFERAAEFGVISDSFWWLWLHRLFVFVGINSGAHHLVA